MDIALWERRYRELQDENSGLRQQLAEVTAKYRSLRRIARANCNAWLVFLDDEDDQEEGEEEVVTPVGVAAVAAAS